MTKVFIAGSRQITRLPAEVKVRVETMIEKGFQILVGEGRVKTTRHFAVPRWQDYMGEILARNGFAAIAVAYFAMERLPKELDQIPLEYFQNVLAYVRSHRSLNPDRMGIAGNSKGAELALLLASQDPAIRAVVAFAPSSVVWQSLTVAH